MLGLGDVNKEKPIRSSSQILFLFTFGCYILSMIAPQISNSRISLDSWVVI